MLLPNVIGYFIAVLTLNIKDKTESCWPATACLLILYINSASDLCIELFSRWIGDNGLSKAFQKFLSISSI